MELGLKDSFLVSMYLVAIVTANLVVTAFGQAALPYTAFFLIPFDLVVRDVLHDRWKKNLRLKMGGLILGGSVLSLIVNSASWRIGVASFSAFLVAGAVDTLVYTMMAKHGRFARMNGSNAASSITDSIIFPLIAFGSLSLLLCAAQALAKFTGGIIWSALFCYKGHHVDSKKAVHV